MPAILQTLKQVELFFHTFILYSNLCDRPVDGHPVNHWGAKYSANLCVSIHKHIKF